MLSRDSQCPLATGARWCPVVPAVRFLAVPSDARQECPVSGGAMCRPKVPNRDDRYSVGVPCSAHYPVLPGDA